MLNLRDGEDDLLNGLRLRSIIEKYSDHISVPILMPGEPADQAEDEADTPKPDVTVNRASALWTRPEERTHRQGLQRVLPAHLRRVHAIRWPGCTPGSRGRTSTRCCCSSRPARRMTSGWRARRGVRLHVQRVFIMEDTGQILPKYLRFVRGVIDSSDLPLNVSREILQGSRAVDNIRSAR